MKKAFGLGAAVAVSVLAASPVLADTVKMHGATTVLTMVVNPNRAAVEKATGHTLDIVGNATGKGLVDLAEGKAEVSMVSEPLDIAVAAAETAGKKIDPSTLKFSVVKQGEIVFVVHPGNGAGTLTWEQLRDIHTGKITNWKQVGGKDLAITVYSDALTGGTRAMVKKVVMGGEEYGASVKALTSVARVAEVVAKDESGVGAVGRGFVRESRTKIVATKKIERPLGFVTIGEPSPKVKQVIEAFRASSK